MGPAVDRETQALASLAQARARARGAAFLPLLLVGIALGAVGYTWFRDLQFAMTDRGGGGVSFPLLSGVVGFGVPVVVCGGVGQWLGRHIVRQRTPAWARAIAVQHGLAPHALTETSDLLAD